MVVAKRIAGWALVLGLLLACGGPSGTSEGGSALIGPEGGLVQAEGLTLSVPAGALASAVELRIRADEFGAPEVAERVRVSPVFQILPESTRFLVPATVVVAYRPGPLPAGVSVTGADVRRLDAGRAQERLAALFVDADAGTVAGETLGLGRFWATVPAGPRPVRLTVTPASKVVFEGDEVAFAAELRDQSDRPMTGEQVTWSSSNEAVARVDATGRAVALAPGITEIIARAGAIRGKATLQVASAVPFPQALTWENPLPQGNPLHAVGGAESRVLVGGANGALWLGTAQGWSSLHFSRGAVFRDVVLGPSEAYAVGSRAGHGLVVRWDGARSSELTVPDTELRSLWIEGGRGMAVGAGPNLALTDGTGAWSVEPTPVTEPLLAAGASGGLPVVIGARGAVYQRTSEGWRALSSTPLSQLQIAARVRGEEAFAISETTLLRFAAGSWSPVALPAEPVLRLTGLGVAGEALVVAGVTAEGQAHLLLETGAGFVNLPRPTSTPTAIWGRSAEAIYAVSATGAIDRYDGEQWRGLREGSTDAVASIAAFEGPRVLAAANRCADEACSSLRGVVLERDAEGRYSRVSEPFLTELRAIGGRGVDDVWALGYGDIAYRRGAGGWEAIQLLGVNALFSIASCEHGLYAGGAGRIYKETGGSWIQAGSSGYAAIRSVACDRTGLFAIGDYSIMRFEGGRVTMLDPRDDELYPALWRAIWSTPDGVAFVGGDARYILQWTGTKFVPHDQPAGLKIARVEAIWGTGFGSVWAAGLLVDGGSFLVHFNGATWQSVEPGFDGGVRALAGLPSGELWIGGASGALLHGAVAP